MATRGSLSSQQQQSYISAPGQDDLLYEELWKLCAGPLVDVPRTHDRVYYFPQGHMEQLEASTNEELDQKTSMFSLSPKILCQVVNIKLQVEPETDEVYAQITLLPEDEMEHTNLDSYSHETSSSHEPSRPKVYSFCKVLTASDTSTHGGFSVLRKHATECLPPLDLNQQTPSQDLVALDLHRIEWRFKHIFRGQPRRHLLTTGWSNFVSSKRLVAGDSFLFLRGENGELRVGIRHHAQKQNSIPSSVISSRNMHLGVLATASHAVTTKTLFVVNYKPRMSQFIVGLRKYKEAVNQGFLVGMRFKMRFEVEDSPERRFMGTIVGVEDISTQWKDSDWRSLKVHWDEPVPITRPDRVSPWDIEPFVPSIPSSLALPAAPKNKRPRQVIETTTVLEPTLSTASTVWNPSLDSLQANSSPQGQRVVECAWPSHVKPNASTWSVASNHVPAHTVEQKDNLTTRLGDKRKSDAVPPCRLFGIDLNSTSAGSTIEISKAAVEGCFSKTPSFGDSEQKSDLSIDTKGLKQEQSQVTQPKEGQTNQNSSIRSRTKVQMQGVAVGRAVDLTPIKGYDELISELEDMFEIHGELRPRKKWEIVFTDDEGDTMLMGDHPWLEFCSVVRRILICSNTEVKKTSAGNTTPSSVSESITVNDRNSPF
nr:auxin response factor 9-like isoform X1 [Ipomoea batatas]